MLLGDFNIAPEERDVRYPDLWRGHIHFHPKEHAALARITSWGLHDLLRKHHEEGGLFSWWDYRQLAFQKNNGLRIDLILGTKKMLDRCTGVEIFRDERKGESPSDHVPVVATFSSRLRMSPCRGRRTPYTVGVGSPDAQRRSLLALAGLVWAALAVPSAVSALEGGAPAVQLVAPRAGAALAAGSTAELEWAPAGPQLAGVEEWEAFLSLDGGETYPVRITPHLDQDLRRVPWQVPATAHAGRPSPPALRRRAPGDRRRAAAALLDRRLPGRSDRLHARQRGAGARRAGASGPGRRRRLGGRLPPRRRAAPGGRGRAPPPPGAAQPARRRTPRPPCSRRKRPLADSPIRSAAARPMHRLPTVDRRSRARRDPRSAFRHPPPDPAAERIDRAPPVRLDAAGPPVGARSDSAIVHCPALQEEFSHDRFHRRPRARVARGVSPLALGVTTSLFPLNAQEAPQEPAPTVAETIQVTATRTPEDVETVPASITVISGEELARPRRHRPACALALASRRLRRARRRRRPGRLGARDLGPARVRRLPARGRRRALGRRLQPRPDHASTSPTSSASRSCAARRR